MSHAAPPLRQVGNELQQLAHAAGPWLNRLARMGLATRGALYLLVAVLALLASVGWGRTNQSGSAAQLLVGYVLGRVLLGAAAGGMAGFGLWALAQGALHRRRRSMTRLQEVARRGRLLFIGIVDFVIAAALGEMALGYRAASNDAAQYWTAVLMRVPAGIWLTGGIGLGVILYAVYQLYRAAWLRLDDALSMGRQTRRWVRGISRFGIAARAVVFGLIGLALVLAAIGANPNRAVGLAQALAMLQKQPYGSALLALVGLGLGAYAVRLFALALYARMEGKSAASPGLSS